MAPFQTTVNIRQDAVENNSQDIIDVQILPDEEIWTENTTAITGNTSERSESIDGVDPWMNDDPSPFNVTFHRYFGPISSCFIIMSAIFSPLVMVILPKLGVLPYSFTVLPVQQKLIFSSCNIDCKGHLISLIFKVTLLGIGNWAVFSTSKKVFMPRLSILKTGVMILTILCVSTYWLFYIMQVNLLKLKKY